MKSYRNNKFGAILTAPTNLQEEFSDTQLDKIPSEKLFYYLLVDYGAHEYTDIVTREKDCNVDGLYIHQAAVERNIEIYRHHYGQKFVNTILAAD